MLTLFQSTLPQGERPVPDGLSPSLLNFNPRSRKGSDIDVSGGLWNLGISIHAPARGATKLRKLRLHCYVIFQSTLPQGERQRIVGSIELFQNFNPRSRKGSDPNDWPIRFTEKDFNPRSRKGSDKITHQCVCIIDISIHAPARGATYTGANYDEFQTIFQSTLPQGERLYMSLI